MGLGKPDCQEERFSRFGQFQELGCPNLCPLPVKVGIVPGAGCFRGRATMLSSVPGWAGLLGKLLRQ
jgi:hypothetical protein